jgi:cyclopropane fatty-acyl-phospholipid synthase-like methyltransferase
MPTHDRTSFENLYAGQPRWEIGRPQQAIVDAADQITGSILDVGCGSGENALYFAARGGHVTGIDFLAEPIAIARQKAAERGLAATFLVHDALSLDQLAQTFDNAIDSGLFHVFSDADRARYVAGLAKLLKPGGRLFLLCFSDQEPGDTGPRRITRSELDAAFSEAWAIESVRPSQYEVRSDTSDAVAGADGPKAWFMIARRR